MSESVGIGRLYQGPKFLTLPSPKARHCEEPVGDEAIQGRSTVRAVLDCRAAKWRLAMTTVNIRGFWYYLKN
jgi:hypothetical protein